MMERYSNEDEREQMRLRLREDLENSIKKPSSWYPEYINKNADIVVYHPECPYSLPSGNISEHRYIWWLNHKKEPIRYNEIIHHINGNHQDNRIENLMKCKRKLHGILHRQMQVNKHKLNSAIQESCQLTEKIGWKPK